MSRAAPQGSSAFAARIAELVAMGRSPRAAKRAAKRERRLAMAEARFERTGDASAFKALEAWR